MTFKKGCCVTGYGKARRKGKFLTHMTNRKRIVRSESKESTVAEKLQGKTKLSFLSSTDL